MNTATEIVSIPLNKLVVHRSMFARLEANPLTTWPRPFSLMVCCTISTVAAQTNKHGKPTEKFEVVAGARRLAALLKLAKEKKITKTFAVPCLPVDLSAAPEISLAENTIRQAMHPADQFAAFQQLVDEGMGLKKSPLDSA